MKAVLPFLLCALGVPGVFGETRIYQTPEGESLSSEYEVWVGTNRVDVYSARVLDAPFAGKEWDYGGNYCFANFDLSGPAELRIRAKRSLANLVVRPTKENVSTRANDDRSVTLSLPGPCLLSLEPDGKRSPLLLFANP